MYIRKLFRNFSFIFFYIIIELRIILLILLTEIYNSISVRNHIRKFFIEEFLEDSCKKIATALKNKLKFDFQKSENSEIILVSRLQKGGGLTDIYNKINNGRNIFTLATNIFEFRSTTHLKIKEGMKIKQINNIGCILRINKLVNYISNSKLRKIHVLNDSSDPLIYIAYLISTQNREAFIFYHHADHSFCFGSLEKDWMHIDLFQNQHQICTKKVKAEFIPMTNFL